jgi:hypothetical protein
VSARDFVSEQLRGEVSLRHLMIAAANARVLEAGRMRSLGLGDAFEMRPPNAGGSPATAYLS